MPWPHKNKPRTGRRKIGSTKRANRRKNRKQAKKQCTNHKKYGTDCSVKNVEDVDIHHIVMKSVRFVYNGMLAQIVSVQSVGYPMKL